MSQLRQRIEGLIRGGRRMVGRWIPGARAFRNAWRLHQQRRHFRSLGTPRELFQRYYVTNKWGSEESVSGPGSTLAYTANVRQELPRLLHQLGVTKILDAPCGDFHWFRHIEWGLPIDYVGADIVEEIVNKNQEQFGDHRHRFMTLDITHDPLPEADLWLCRDCWFHLSNQDIFKSLQLFLQSDIRYLLTTTYYQEPANRDVPTGAFRRLNLERAPFLLGRPLTVMEDWIEGYPPRRLALWERQSLIQQQDKSPAYSRALDKQRTEIKK